MLVKNYITYKTKHNHGGTPALPRDLNTSKVGEGGEGGGGVEGTGVGAKDDGGRGTTNASKLPSKGATPAKCARECIVPVDWVLVPLSVIAGAGFGFVLTSVSAPTALGSVSVCPGGPELLGRVYVPASVPPFMECWVCIVLCKLVAFSGVAVALTVG